MSSKSTIVGVATGTPDGGVAVVRISGPEARRIVEAMAGSVPEPRRASRRRIETADGGHDDGLVVFMPGPGSFTGEDVAELHVHAGHRNVRAVVERCLEAGAVAAGPGDFSRRAFEAGRMTLDQAEGIAAVIAARTDEALRQARRLAGGEVGREVEALRSAVLDLQAEIEANLDFPEDVDPGDVKRWRGEVTTLVRTVGGWLDRFEAARRAREEARVVLAGPPNAGKSSLFNALLQQPRAIVADVPGTTRDYVEARLEVGRFSAVIVDTAGIRTSEDAIETEGVLRSAAQVAQADVVLWLEAADSAPCGREGMGSAAHVIEIETKRDLGMRRPDWLGIRVVEGAVDGLDGLRAALAEWFEAEGSATWVGLARHRDRARDAWHGLERARAGLQAGQELELVAFELGAAEQRLGEITGRSRLGPLGRDLQDRIFAKFCIGK